MKRWITALAFAFLAGCATVSDFHTACMEGNAAFAAQVACVRANVAQSGGLQNDTLVQEYVLTGELLARQVAAGQISEDQARLQWVAKLNDVRQAQLNEMAAQAAIHRAWDWPRYTDCRQDGTNFYCTSW